MASFTLPSLETQDISTGTFYAHIVDTIPGDSTISVSQLDISDAIGYAPVELTGMTYSNVKWDFDDITFPSFYFNTIPVGVCICKRVGLANSSSDPVITFLDFVNILKQPLILTVGRYSIALTFPDTGVVRFNQYYQYNSGAFANTEFAPKGLIYLLGTRNETQAYQNPLGTALLGYTSSNFPDSFINDYFSRTANGNTNTGGNVKIAFNFGSRRIRVGTIGIRNINAAGVGAGFTVYGSNTAPNVSVTTTPTAAPTLWTTIATGTFGVINTWSFATSSNTTYWKNIAIEVVGGASIEEIEFYDSSMYSTDPNLMSTVIDSSFQTTIADNSGFGHTWTNTGAVIDGESLYLNGSATATLSASTLFNLGSRNFQLSIDFKNEAGASGAQGILNWDGGDFPLSYYIVGATNNYNFSLGTSVAWFADFTSMGQPSGTKFDALTVTRTGNNFNLIADNTTQTNTNIASSGSIGVATNIRLGRNQGVFSRGFIRNFKLVT
jgi:hypothetical protein